jgi:ribonuclease Z
MMPSKIGRQLTACIVALVAVCGFHLSNPIEGLGAAAQAAQKSRPGFSPVKALSVRDAYYPGTEDIAPDEMRVTACGTGMPNSRPKQAAACFLVELGNGDKFIFDIGSNSFDRLSALAIPMDYLDKVFIGHLHSDHFGALGDLWVGGMIGNRQRPLRIWGPSGAKPELGTKAAVEHMQKMLAWDTASRRGNVNTRGSQIQITEFDYRGVNKVIYQENGVTIRSIPAIHAIDGPVSFILTWNGLKFAFSSDTYPNKWWLEHTKGADIAIHECFLTPRLLVSKQQWPVKDSLNVGTQVHTAPSMFGKVMSIVKPRLAVGYHFFNDFDTAPDVEAQVRQTYAGPLALAVDYMVFNITKNKIRVRMAKINEDVWPLPSVTEKLSADPSKRIGFSDYITSGREVFSDVIKAIYDETNKLFGSNEQPPK